MALLDEIRAGLRASPRQLPCKLFYDEHGAALFEHITRLDAYYLTRVELALLEAHLPAIAARVGPRARVIEPGSGEGLKTRLLLGALAAPALYVPIDVSAEQLARTAHALNETFAGLEVRPLCADYEGPLRLPPAPRTWEGTLVFFPGSTIGNFEPDEARRFLARFGDLAGPGAHLLLGADATQDVDALRLAYDDPDGVTAEFNLNLLSHLNARLGTDFDVAGFRHRAVWNPAHHRMEIYLVSVRAQEVSLAGERFGFAEGEAILTEHCHKLPLPAMRELLDQAGWRVLEQFVGAPHPMTLWLAVRDVP